MRSRVPASALLAPCCLSVLCSLSPVTAAARWQLDGTAVCTAPVGQYQPGIVPDGAGGAIVSWFDYRSGLGDVYAQRLGPSGAAMWTTDGTPLCTAAGDQRYPDIAANGSVGALVTWQDARSGQDHIYAQSIDLSGATQWTADGVALCTAANGQQLARIVSDGTGGAIVTWEDSRSGASDIYAQRVDASGAVLWAPDGTALCTATGIQSLPHIISDGAGGAIVAWQDLRGATYDVYAQRIDTDGNVQWTPDGVPICTAADQQYDPKLVSDGVGGAIVAWQDYRTTLNYEVYAQRIDASGLVQWASDGVALTSHVGDQYVSAGASDGSGGAIFVWEDYRLGNADIYAQRIDASGVVRWTFDGVALCTATSDQYTPDVVPDGAGGAIVTWSDTRSAARYDIYARRVLASGTTQWDPDGVPLCTAANSDYNPRIASDGAGGAIVTWYDYRTGVAHIRAQRVESRYGSWGRPEPTLTNAYDNPGDQGGQVVLNWTASDRDALNQLAIQQYTVWRAVDPVVAASRVAANDAVEIEEPRTTGTARRSPPLWHERSGSNDYYWELVGSQEAYYNAAYSFTAPTRQDSTQADPALHEFRIAAEGADQFTNWPSNVLAASSVDNLAPAAPLALTAQRVGPDVQLQWNGVGASDLRDYAVYRATTSGVAPVPGNFLAADADTVLVDAAAPTGPLYYVVTAYDVHENQGPPSNEASVSGATDLGGLPPVTALTVLQNRPNPFTTTTAFDIGLPSAGPIRLDVYDVAGRHRRTIRVTGAKGWQSVSLDGVDDHGNALASGVYVCRVRANGVTTTRKMLRAR